MGKKEAVKAWYDSFIPLCETCYNQSYCWRKEKAEKRKEKIIYCDWYQPIAFELLPILKLLIQRRSEKRNGLKRHTVA